MLNGKKDKNVRVFPGVEIGVDYRFPLVPQAKQIIIKLKIMSEVGTTSEK